MSEELPAVAPILEVKQQVVLPAEEVLRPSPPLPPVTPEEARALETVFAARDQENDTVAGILGMYTGMMILKDVAVDTFTPPADKVEEEERKRRPRGKK